MDRGAPPTAAARSSGSEETIVGVWRRRLRRWWRPAAIVAIGVILVVPGYLAELREPTAGLVPVALLVTRLVLDVGVGFAALVLYLRRDESQPTFGLLVIALGALSTVAYVAGLFALASIAARRRVGEIATAIVVTAAAQWAGLLLRGALAPPDPSATRPAALEFWALPPLGSRGSPQTGAESGVFEFTVGSEVISSIVLVVGLVVLGIWIDLNRSRQAEAMSSEQHARVAAESNLARARADERTRIAREMHDSLAHHLSLVALHAGAIELRDDLPRAEVRAAVGVIGETTRVALTELRVILGVLRQPDGGGGDELRSRPTVDDFRHLVEAVRGSGSDVDLRIEPASALEDLPHGLDLHVYRFVQEVLTNAGKHAPGARIHVAVRIEARERVELSAWNAVPPRAAATVPSGFGLTGLGERMRLAGGGLSIVSDGSVFGVTAWMPWST